MSEDPTLSARIKRLRPSPTIAVNTLAKQLKAEGRDIINVSTGEPDFDTPEHIKESARKAMADGQTKYTAVAGTMEVRQAVCGKMSRDNGLSYDPDQIVVSCGAKHSIMNLMQCTVDHGDEVVLAAPCWASYPDMVSFCGGVPKFIVTTSDSNYKITPDQLREAIGPKTVMFAINSPNNPSGAMYSEAELKALGEVLANHPQVLICSDEIYEHVVYKGSAVSFATACPELMDRIVIINGASKAYAMTGWRIGFSASGAALAKAMTTVQSQSTSSACSIAQAAAATAFESDLDCIKPMLEAFSARRSRVVAAFSKIPGIELAPIDGAFYAFPQINSIITALHSHGIIAEPTDEEFCKMLLSEYGVAAVPGSVFEGPGAFRMSFATEDELVDKAMERITEALTLP